MRRSYARLGTPNSPSGGILSPQAARKLPRRVPPSLCFPVRAARRTTYPESSGSASRYRRTTRGIGASASERHRGLMGAWCGIGSRSDLRRRPRHRCAVATPAPLAIGGSATDVATSVNRPGDVDDVSTTATAHLSLIACRGSVATSFPARPAGADSRVVAEHGDGDVAPSATAPRGASPQASRRPSRRARLAKAACCRGLVPPADRLTVTTCPGNYVN